MSALSQNFAASIWMSYRQAGELNAHVRKGERGSLVVYANAITRTEHDDNDDKTDEDGRFNFFRNGPRTQPTPALPISFSSTLRANSFLAGALCESVTRRYSVKP
jgi:hypothetical protein